MFLYWCTSESMPYQHVYINCEICNHFYIIAQLYRCVKFIIYAFHFNTKIEVDFNFFVRLFFLCIYFFSSCALKLGWPTWLNIISEYLKASIFVNKIKTTEKVKH